MVTRFKILFLSSTLFLIGMANADIYQLPQKIKIYENTTSQILGDDFANSKQPYKVVPIDSGYVYDAPTSNKVKTDLVNKNFVSASTTFVIGQL